MTLPLFLSKWQTGAKNILIPMRILANWKNALETFENVLKYPRKMWLAFFEIFGWMVRFYELKISAFLDKFRLDVHMNLWEIFGIVSVQYRAVLRPIIMEMILLIGGGGEITIQQERWRYLEKPRGWWVLQVCLGSRVCPLEKLHQGWFPHCGSTSKNWENQP